MPPPSLPALPWFNCDPRVFVELPVEAYGTDLSGVDFWDLCVTHSISSGGASLVIDRKLAPDQELTLRLYTGKEANVRVVGQMGESEGISIYGTSFLQAQHEFWGRNLSHSAEPAATGKALLECLACHRREHAALHEMELAVLVSQGRLQRKCHRCGVSTIWMTPGETRRTRRTAMKKLAGIRHLSRVDLAQTVDISRLGFRFSSRLLYERDASIESAVPYIQGGVNIFTPGRIVWVASEKGVYEYGVEHRSPSSHGPESIGPKKLSALT